MICTSESDESGREGVAIEFDETVCCCGGEAVFRPRITINGVELEKDCNTVGEFVGIL